MEEPFIRVELVDGTNTWITYAPLRQLDHVGAEMTAGEVFAHFVSNLARQREAVDEHLRPFREAAWEKAARDEDRVGHHSTARRIRELIRGNA